MAVVWRILAGAAKGGLGTLIAVATLTVYVPIAPLFPTTDIDGGWMFALNVAVERGLVFGRDLVFTFGPYGAAYTQLYHPATDTMMLISTTLLGMAFASGLLCLTHGWVERLGALGLVAMMGLIAHDAMFFALPLTLLLLVCRVAGAPRGIAASRFVQCSLALLVMALSLIPLVKGTFAAASGLAMALSFGLLVLRGQWRLAAAGAMLFAVSMPVLWVLVGQPLPALPGFFISQAPIISGYTEAMSMPTGWFMPIQFLIGYLVLAALHFRLTSVAGIVMAVGCTGLTFFAFKGGFVRADAHMMMAGGFIVIMAAMLAFEQNRLRGAIGVMVGLVVWAIIDMSLTQASLAALPGRIATPFVAASKMLVTRVVAPDTLRRRYADGITMIAAHNPLPRLTGSTDIYSYGQSILLADGMDWVPRPVLQSYSAYTPSLAALDTAFLAGPKAAQNILFSVQPIDGRLAALEDGPSWPELLSRYDIVDLRGDMAILRRRQTKAPEPIGQMPLAGVRFRMGDMMALPAGSQPIWAKIDVAPTTLGKLVSAAFRPPALSITYRFSDGHQQVFRYVSGMGAAGFLISPVVSSTTDFVSLALPRADDYLAGKRAQSFTISSEYGMGLLWNPEVSVTFSRASFPPQPDVGQWLFARMETEAARPAKLPVTADCSVDLIDLHRPQDLPMRIGTFVQVDGWAAISVKDALAPDVTSVTLTAPNGEVSAIRAKKIARDDVNAYFQKPEMGQIGYTALADLAGLAGDYLLGLRMTKGDRSWSCSTQIPVQIGGR